MPLIILSTLITEENKETTIIEMVLSDNDEVDYAVEKISLRIRIGRDENFVPRIQRAALKRAAKILNGLSDNLSVLH